MFPIRQLWASLGDLYSKIDKEELKPVLLRIVKTYVHPDYGLPINDVSLFELERDVQFSQWIRPACLHTDFKIPATHATATGWGMNSENGSASPILKKDTLKLIDMATCELMWNNLGHNLTKGVANIENMIVCAGGEIGQNVCHGDSGGPLQFVISDPRCMYSIVGITSFGIGCARKLPSVFTRVSSHVCWIENIVWP